MNKNDSILLIIDVQENLAPSMKPRSNQQLRALLNVAKTEHPLVTSRIAASSARPRLIANVLGDDGAYFEKDTLSCYKMTISAALSKIKNS
ncbi:MAG: hypothetical protein ACLSE6_05555 [Alphaproteobacteria bacterium]